MLGSQSFGVRRSHRGNDYGCHCDGQGTETGGATTLAVEASYSPQRPEAAAYVRNDGEVKWHLNDLDVATVEELHPEGAMEVQKLRALVNGMGMVCK